jgi:integrase
MGSIYRPKLKSGGKCSIWWIKFYQNGTFFRGRRLATIGQPDVDRYVLHRQRQGRKPTTIHRELTTRVKALRLAYRNGKLLRLPSFTLPREDTVRQGFFEPAQYLAVCKRLPEDLQAALAIMHLYGWRKREVLALARRQLDLEAGTLRLDPGETKNREGRVVYLTPELKSLLGAQVVRVKALEKKLGKIIPWVFPHLAGAPQQSPGAHHVAVVGEPIRDFRKAWVTACKAAGVAGRTHHDLRRTAVRNMERAGVPRAVAMKLTGHKTESVYRRYAIVSDADLQEAALRLNAAQGPVYGPLWGGRAKSAP